MIFYKRILSKVFLLEYLQLCTSQGLFCQRAFFENIELKLFAWNALYKVNMPNKDNLQTNFRLCDWCRSGVWCRGSNTSLLYAGGLLVQVF